MHRDTANMELTETVAPESAVPWLTIPAMLADNLVRHAQRTAIVDGDTRIDYAELARRMQPIAAALGARDLGRGDVVALWAPNSWQWVVCAVACWWRGCTVVPIPARGRILDAMPILQATRARLLFTCSAASSGNLPSLIAEHLLESGVSLHEACPHLEAVVDFSGDDAPVVPGQVGMAAFAASGQAAGPAADVSGEDVCAILFTSGSTGRPKGIPRRHGQILRNRWATSLNHGYRHDDRLLVVSEFSHALGFNGNLLRSLMLGATLVIAHTRSPHEIASLVRAERITAMGAPPSLFSTLLRERIDGGSACGDLRLVLTGAANIPPALVREMIAAGVDTVISAYGMTECDTISSTSPSDSPEVIATSVGRPEAGLELRIADGGGMPVPAGVEGEIWVRGYAVADSFLAADGRAEPATDAQGWLHTGDMGCFTPQGYLQILGRKKDVITIHGYTLFPAEIENLMSRSGLLKDIAVVGIPHAVAGELCVAFIVPADPAAFSLKRLRLWARRNVADYKIPGRFVVVDSLPLNRNGKVDRLSLLSSLEA
jgi:acyl-CoA synthetase (AMP-forming)/AMP-acid ligase II